RDWSSDVCSSDLGGLRSFAAITLPHLQPMLVVVTLFEILVALTAFDMIFALTGGGPGTATTVLSYFIWAESFKMLSFGKGLALATIIAGLSVVLIAALMRLMPREALVGEGRGDVGPGSAPGRAQRW